MALNLLTQILIIRYLSKTDYGMFAYALTLVAMLTTMNSLGMERAVARFVPIYDEKNDLASAAGVVILAIGTLVALGGATVVLVVGFQGLLAGTLSENPAVITVLVVLVTLAPVNALNNVMEALLSALGKPRIIFFSQRYNRPVPETGGNIPDPACQWQYLYAGDKLYAGRCYRVVIVRIVVEGCIKGTQPDTALPARDVQYQLSSNFSF